MKEKDPFDSSHLLRKFLLDYLYSTNQTFAFDFLGNIASGMRVFVVPITEISRQSFFRDGIESSPFEVIFSTNLHLDLELPASTRRQLSGQLSTFLEACWADYDNLVKHLDEKGKEYDSNDLMALARSQTLLVHAIDLFADQVVSEVINPYGLRDQSLKELTQYEETRNEESKTRYTGAIVLETLLTRGMLYRSKLEVALASSVGIDLGNRISEKDDFIITSKDTEMLRDFVNRKILSLDLEMHGMKTSGLQFQHLARLANHLGKIKSKSEFDPEVLGLSDEEFIKDLNLDNFEDHPEIKSLLKRNNKVLRVQQAVNDELLEAFGHAFGGIDLETINYAEYVTRLAMVEKEINKKGEDKHFDLIHHCLPLESIIEGNKAKTKSKSFPVAILETTTVSALEPDKEAEYIAKINSTAERSKSTRTRSRRITDSHGVVSGPLYKFFSWAPALGNIVHSCVQALEYYRLPTGMHISGIKEKKKLGIVPTGKLDIAILDPVHEVLTSEGVGIIRTAEIITQENERIKKLKEEAPLREAAATKVQSLARGFLARKKSPSDETLSTISADSVIISPELNSARKEFEKHGGRRRLESLDLAKTKEDKKPKLRNGRGRSASI